MLNLTRLAWLKAGAPPRNVAEAAFRARLAGGGVIETTLGPSDLVIASKALAEPLVAHTVSVIPAQSGSGTPSPDNIRSISGWTGANVYHSGADTSDPTTYAISWNTEAGTVYGGTLDVLTGKLTVTHGYVDLGTLSYSQGFSGFYTLGLKDVVEIPDSVTSSGLLSSHYVVGNTANADQMYIQRAASYLGWIIFLPSTSYANASAFKNAMNGVQLVYALATPIEYTLTATQITMLLGTNTLWADCGQTTITYKRKK